MEKLDMEKQAQRTIQKYRMVHKGELLIIGVSGGADSMAAIFFFNALKIKWQLRLVAVHINHQLRGGEADLDEQLVSRYCKKNEIGLDVYHCDVAQRAKEDKISIEEAGRLVRYQCFEKSRRKHKGDKIVTAHHLNDQAETFLFRLIRGAGIKGLGAIQPVRGRYIRPLIECSRVMIEKYCEQHRISYRNDATNNNTDFTRNYIRLKLLPALQSMNPNVAAVLSATAEQLRRDGQYLDNQAAIVLSKCLEENEHGVFLEIATLLQEHSAISTRLICMALKRFDHGMKDVTAKHINSLLALCGKQTGKQMPLPNGIIVRVHYGKLWFASNKQEVAVTAYAYPIQPGDFIYVKEAEMFFSMGWNCFITKKGFENYYTKAIDYDKIEQNVTIRNRRKGDKIQLPGGSKTLKKHFIDMKIPAGQRDTAALVADGGQIIWVVGAKASIRYMKNERTARVAYIQTWGKKDETNSE